MLPLLLLASRVLAATPVQLPPGESAATWSESLALAGLTVGSPGASVGAEVSVLEGRWVVRARDAAGKLHQTSVPPPTTEQSREDFAWLVASLVRPMGEVGVAPGLVGPVGTLPGVAGASRPRPTRPAPAPTLPAPTLPAPTLPAPTLPAPASPSVGAPVAPPLPSLVAAAEPTVREPPAVAPATAEPVAAAPPAATPVATPAAIPPAAVPPAALPASAPTAAASSPAASPASSPVASAPRGAVTARDARPPYLAPPSFDASAASAVSWRAGADPFPLLTLAVGVTPGVPVRFGIRAERALPSDLVSVGADRSVATWALAGTVSWTSGWRWTPTVGVDAGVAWRRYAEAGAVVGRVPTPVAGAEVGLPIPLWRWLSVEPAFGLDVDLRPTDLIVPGTEVETLSPWALRGGVTIRSTVAARGRE